MKKLKSKKSIAIYVIILVVMLILQYTGVFYVIENDAEDSMYQKGGSVSPYIYVIGIDEETLSEYGAFDVWGRDKMADLINLLMADPECCPSVIAIDVGYFGEKDSETDAKLVEAVQNAGNVILTETATFGSVVGQKNQVVVYEEPFDALHAAARGSGHANVTLDGDGVARHASGDLEYNGTRINSFDMAVYKAYLESKGQEFSESSPGAFGENPSGFYISYSGMPRAYYGSVGAGCSFKRVLEGEYPVQAFKDAIVFVGAYASGMQDSYYCAIDPDTQMYGVEIHANITNQLINGTCKTEITETSALLPTALLGVISILAMMFLSLKFAVPAELILGSGYILLTGVLSDKANILLPIIVPALTVAIIMVVYIVVSYVGAQMEKRRIVSNYGKYLSPEIAKSIAQIGEESLSLGGIKKDIAILFVDIRSFTTLSESLPPERVVEMLNSYLKITTSSIFNNQGTVDKFIGDATMGVFNAPLDLDDYTYKAVCAGLEMAQKGKAIDNELPDDLKGRVGFGVGINCGDAIVGNIGTDFRMEYTAIGDTVNTASRLEGQAKAGNVVISASVYERVKDRIRCEDMGKVRLKGKAEPVQIYRAVEII